MKSNESLSKVEKLLFKSHLQTKDDVIEIMKSQIETFKQIKMINKKIRKLEEKNG
jgi:hypothetical protein